VSLSSANTAVGGFFNTTTDANGLYSVTDVPVGRFTVTASDPPRSRLGETSGQLDQDGQSITADVHLSSTGVNLPTYFYDANDFFFDVQQNASILDGTDSVYGGDFSGNQGAFSLSLISGGTPTTFSGGPVGTTELNGRQIAVQERNLVGLDVTRKVFVPQDGYFRALPGDS